MTNSVLNQAFFGLYEFFANIIPGTLIVLTFVFIANLVGSFPSTTTVPESVLLILLVFLAFIVGLAMQGISAYVEKYVNKRKYQGYPSSLYLNEDNDTFPKYFKDRIREIANKKFGTPLDASSQHIFELCYTYVMQKSISTRVPQFLRVYTFSRNMIVTMAIEAVVSFFLLIQQQQILFGAAGLASIGLTYIFYKRFLRYSGSFAKEVYRSFLVDEDASKTQ